MHHQPAAYEVGGRPAKHYHHFAQKYEPYKPDVATIDSDIDYGLGHKRHHKLHHTSKKKSGHYLYEIFPILTDVTHQKPERPSLWCVALLFTWKKFVSGLEKHRHPFRLAAGTVAKPATFEFFGGIRYLAFGRIGYIEPLSVTAHLVQHRKMILIPMKYAWFRSRYQTFNRHFRRHRPQSEPFGRFADAEHRHPLGGREAITRQWAQGIFTTESAAHHGQTCHTALHRVFLPD